MTEPVATADSLSSDNAVISLPKFTGDDFVVNRVRGHKGLVNTLDTHFTEHHLFASGSEDCSVRLWDLRGGAKTVKCLLGSSHPIAAVMFDPKDSNILYSVMNGCNLCISDIRKEGLIDREPLSTIEFELSVGCDVNSTCVHKKENVVAIADDEKVTIVDLIQQRQRVFTRVHSNVVSKVAFKPNSIGDIASCGFDYIYNSWDYRTGR